MYALASVLSALLVVGASLVGVVVHFTLKVSRYDQEIPLYPILTMFIKNDVISECTILSTGADASYVRAPPTILYISL